MAAIGKLEARLKPLIAAAEVTQEDGPWHIRGTMVYGKCEDAIWRRH